MIQNSQQVSAKPQGMGSAEAAAPGEAFDFAAITATIGAIQRLLMRGANFDSETLEKTAMAFDAVCKESGRRLNKCCALLTAGNLVAALELAEHAPALPDVMHALSFPESKAWHALLARNKRVPPPPLNPRQARQLEDAYLLPDSIGVLRKIFELSKSARASTLEQIATARRMRLIDRGNPAWITQLAALEAQRQAEILALVSGRSTASLSLQDATALVSELTQPQWLVLPAQKTIDEARTFQNTLRQQELEETLNGVLDRILDARERRDYSGMEDIVRHIRTLSDDAGIPPGHMEAIQQARQWLVDQNENFHGQMNDLELMLDELAPSRRVRYLLREIEDAGRTLPPILFQRTASYLTQHDLGEQRRANQLRVILVFFAFAAAAVAAWLVILKV